MASAKSPAAAARIGFEGHYRIEVRRKPPHVTVVDDAILSKTGDSNVFQATLPPVHGTSSDVQLSLTPSGEEVQITLTFSNGRCESYDGVVTQSRGGTVCISGARTSQEDTMTIRLSSLPSAAGQGSRLSARAESFLPRTLAASASSDSLDFSAMNGEWGGVSHNRQKSRESTVWTNTMLTFTVLGSDNGAPYGTLTGHGVSVWVSSLVLPERFAPP